MYILGIDPGFAMMGWGIIRKTNRKFELIDCGVIKTDITFSKNISKIANRYTLKRGQSIAEIIGTDATKEVQSDMLLRLDILKFELSSIFMKYKIDIVSVETLFFFKNQKTVIQVAQARGVILQTCFENTGKDKSKIFEFTPMQVKMFIAGNGHANKGQVEKMVRLHLNIEDKIRPDDAADAVAIAIVAGLHVK